MSARGPLAKQVNRLEDIAPVQKQDDDEDRQMGLKNRTL